MPTPIKPTTLKPIKPNGALELDYQQRLKKFNTAVNNSFQYWTLATVNKYLGKNISKQLVFNFNALIKEWDKRADEFAKAQAKRMASNVDNYVNVNLAKQDPFFALKGARPKAIQNSLNAIYERNYNLIKSIPSEIKDRFQSVFLNNVNNFDREAILNQVKTIEGISDRRAKVIARDQTQKAVSEYHATREQSLGFEYYVWETAHDERVSRGNGGHAQLDGRMYRYDEPTAVIDSYGNVGHPSDRVNCRCRRKAVLLKPNQEVKKVSDGASGSYYILVEKK